MKALEQYFGSSSQGIPSFTSSGSQSFGTINSDPKPIMLTGNSTGFSS